MGKLSVSKTYEEKRKQIVSYLNLGINNDCGIPEGDFEQMLLEITPEPEPGRENPLLVLPPRIITPWHDLTLNLNQMMELIVVMGNLGINYFTNFISKPPIDLLEAPPRPYWIYRVNDGLDLHDWLRRYSAYNRGTCLRFFENNGYRGLSALEGIAYVIQYRHRLTEHFLILLGSYIEETGTDKLKRVVVLGLYDNGERAALFPFCAVHAFELFPRTLYCEAN